MTIQQFFLILWARRKVIAAVLAVTVFFTLLFSLVMPKEYTATTSLVIDVKSPDPIAGIVLQAMMAPGYMATQIDIINSDRVATRVVRLLGLDKNPDAIEKWQKASGGEGSIESFYADFLQKKLDVRPSRESNVINLNFSGVDPAFTAAVANAYAKAYIETSIDLRTEPARQYAAWFDERRKELRDQLERAQSRLAAYQQDKGIVIADDRVIDNEATRLNELTGLLAAAQGQKAEASSRQKAGTSELSQDVLQNSVIQSIKAELNRAESRLAETSSNLGKNHPQVQQLEAQIHGYKQQLREEIARISGGAAVANKAGTLKENELKAAIEEQKRRVLQLRSERDQLSVLVNDAENARRAYEAVGQRMSQSSLEGQSQQTNVLILSPATKPSKPSRPRVFLNVLVSVFLGAIIGMAVALILEIRQRRIRSAEDMVLLLDLPVLVELDSTLPQEGGQLGRFWKKRFSARPVLAQERQ